MRAPIFILAIVICTVTALAVLSKSRAEDDASKDTTLATTAKSDTGAQAASEATNAPAREPKISVDDAEQIIRGVYQDDSQVWGNGLSWSQLKSSIHEEQSVGLESSFTREDYRPADLSKHPFGSSVQEQVVAGKAYLDAARKLDEIANDLEEAKLFGDADQVREMTAKLRVRARRFPSETRDWPPVQSFSWGNIYR